jgi:hypothetical protein
VIKSLVILVLAVLLVGGAFLSRPDLKDFEEFVRAQQQAGKIETKFVGLFGGDPVENVLKSSTLKDRYLWVTIEQDGRTAYVGAFSQFWAMKQSAESPATGPTADRPAPEQSAAAMPAKDQPKDSSAPRWPNN